MAVDPPVARLDEEIAGLDALDALRTEARPPRLPAIWSATWPKLMAVGAFLLLWEVIVWTGWKREEVLPGPGTALGEVWEIAQSSRFWDAVATTMRRAVVGYAMALTVGIVLGFAISRSTVMRRAFGSFLTGLQSMPSVAWFPLAVAVFGLFSDAPILFVVVLGAAPSIANGLISGVDHIPPLLLRAGKVMGARGLASYRHVVMPAALPGFVAGLKQGWAFSWRSLMAGELIVNIASKTSVGSELRFAQDLADGPAILAWMLVIFTVGVVVDIALFGTVDRRIRQRRGLIEVDAAAV
ncbi:MAG: ABC transporter permease [Actinomycetota bacterium]